MHIGTNAYVPPQHRNRRALRDSIADYANAASSIQSTLVELMCRGVAARHPTLKFVVSEFNSGWIAHWLDRVDQGLPNICVRGERSHDRSDLHEVRPSADHVCDVHEPPGDLASCARWDDGPELRPSGRIEPAAHAPGATSERRYGGHGCWADPTAMQVGARASPG